LGGRYEFLNAPPWPVRRVERFGDARRSAMKSGGTEGDEIALGFL